MNAPKRLWPCLALLAASCLYSVQDVRQRADDASADGGSGGTTPSDASNDLATDVAADVAHDVTDSMADTGTDAPIKIGCAAAVPYPPYACADFEPADPYGWFGPPKINGAATINLVPGAAVAGSTILSIDQPQNGLGAQMTQSFVVQKADKPQLSFWVRLELLAPSLNIAFLAVNHTEPNSPQLDYVVKSSPTRLEFSEALDSGTSTLKATIPVPVKEWLLIETVLNPPTTSAPGSATITVTPKDGTPTTETLQPLTLANGWPTGANTNRVQALVGIVSSTDAAKVSLDDILLWLE